MNVYITSRFIINNPSYMEYGCDLKNPLLLSDRNKITFYWVPYFKSQGLGNMPTVNIINLLSCSWCASLPYSFLVIQAIAILLSSWFCMTIIPIDPISNIQELHCLSSKGHIHDMYLIYIPELDFSSLIFLPCTFAVYFSMFPFFEEKLFNFRSGVLRTKHLVLGVIVMY